MSVAPSPTDRLTLGVEEEFHLVDLHTRQLTPRGRRGVERPPSRPVPTQPELQQTVVETNSEVFDTLSGLRKNLLQLRSELIGVANRLGIGVAAAGTMPPVHVRGVDHGKSALPSHAFRLSTTGA